MPPTLLEQLDDQIRRWSEELQRHTEVRDAAEERIFELREAIRNSLEVRPSLAKTEGIKELPDLDIPGLGVYETVREAYHDIAERGLLWTEEGWTLDELVEMVKRAGFDFGEKNPRRVVNMALVNDPYVDLMPGQRYRINPLPTSEEKGM